MGIGDCSTAGGAPLAPLLAHSSVLGWKFALGHMIVILLVSFGLFNLITAVFVENTLSSAKQDDIKRLNEQKAEKVRVARQLEKLAYKMYHVQTGDKEATP